MSSEGEMNYEDQKKINKFSSVNTQFRITKRSLDKEKMDLRTLQDAVESVEEVTLMDDDALIFYKVGSIFMESNGEELQERLEREKSDATERIAKLESQISNYKQEMDLLKSHLYAKLGNKINLEDSED